MPYIKTTTTVKISDEKKTILKEELGRAIELIPGKNEKWLMLGFTDGITMAFRGDMTTPAAMVEVDIFGTTTAEAYDAMTKKICEIVSRVLLVPSDRIYVKYSEFDRWGYDGMNF